MGVSLIQSNFHGIGSGLGAGDTGVFLHNRGAGFNLIPGHPNELRPYHRPMHTLSPTLWTETGDVPDPGADGQSRLRLLLGTRGGHYQPQILAQVASHRLAAGLGLTESVVAPRWVVDPWATEGATVPVESRMPAPVIDGLRRSGHLVEVAGPWESDWGPVAAIGIGDGGGTACGDPRVTTSGAAVS
jgi:gamma-glutamyltranspeptidase/glutathione hydrolase